MPKIKNIEEIKEQLVDMLMQFDKDLNCNYQTDVYMYYDNATQTARLDTFENVGGNSWLGDDHITIYTDREHYNDYSNFYSEISSIAEALEISYKQLCHEALLYQGYEEYEIEEDTEPSYGDVWDYVNNETKKGYSEKLYQAYCDYIDESRSDYVNSAEEILRPELKYYSNEYGNVMALINYLDDSNKNVDLLNEYLENYTAAYNVSLEELKDKVNIEGFVTDRGYVNTSKFKTYSVRMYVGALYEGDENNPDTGDFEGSIEDGEFDGMLCVDVVAVNEEEAKVFAKLMYEDADCGVLTDFCLDDINIEVELLGKEKTVKEKPIEKE